MRHPQTTNPKSTTATASTKPLISPTPTLPGTTGAVGIDVSKKTFNAAYQSARGAPCKNGVFTSDPIGQAKFLLWLQRVGAAQSCHICLEETGLYGRALATFLHTAGHHVSLVNAALILHFGRSLNLRTKNDPVDARLIAAYTLERVPPRFKPLPPQHQNLRDASRRRQQLKRMIAKEKNHLETTGGKTMRDHVEATLKLLEGQLEQIDAHIEAIITGDAHLSRNRELLMSIPGIAKISATRLLAELPALDSFESARQMCAYAGLTPRERQSGTSVNGRTRMCKQGRSGLRELLFMPAMSLMNSKQGPLKEFAQRLLNAAKKPACVVGALMRKLMALVFAILRSGKPYDAKYHPTASPKKITA